jgi:thiamine biosynthesis lipoprotein
VTSRSTVTFEAIGTRWQIETSCPLPAAVAEHVRACVDTFDAVYSRFRKDSLVSELSRRPGTYRFPADAESLFALYRRLYDATGGAVTPLVGRALEHLGYDASYRLERTAGAVVTPAWDDVLTVSGRVITTRAPVVLDVGAAGKGFLVDRIAELLTDADVADFVVDASGDLIHRGPTTDRVGLESPFDPDHVIGIAQVSNIALCASAVSRRTWGAGLHHIIDPAICEPTGRVLASWVTHPSCAVADGLATALFLAEPETLGRHFSFSYVRLFTDGRVQLSRDFPGELFF